MPVSSTAETVSNAVEIVFSETGTVSTTTDSVIPVFQSHVIRGTCRTWEPFHFDVLLIDQQEPEAKKKAILV